MLIYMEFKSFMNPFLHMVVPFLCQEMLSFRIVAIDLDLVRELARLFIGFAVHCPSTVQFLALIGKSVYEGLLAISRL